MTHREWVAPVCIGDFTLFRQALQECPTIRPIGSCSTDLLGHIGSSGGQLSENTAFAIYSPFAAAYNNLPLSAPTMLPTRWLIPNVRPQPSLVTIKTTLGSLHNGSQSGQGGGLVPGERHDRLVRDAMFRAESRLSRVTSPRMLTAWLHWFYVAAGMKDCEEMSYSEWRWVQKGDSPSVSEGHTPATTTPGTKSSPAEETKGVRNHVNNHTHAPRASSLQCLYSTYLTCPQISSAQMSCESFQIIAQYFPKTWWCTGAHFFLESVKNVNLHWLWHWECHHWAKRHRHSGGPAWFCCCERSVCSSLCGWDRTGFSACYWGGGFGSFDDPPPQAPTIRLPSFFVPASAAVQYRHTSTFWLSGQSSTHETGHGDVNCSLPL